MNKTVFASLTVVAVLFSQAAFANSEETLIQDLNQQLIQQPLTNDDLVASTQDYLLEQAVRPQSRRSPLFAHILDTMVKNATMAQLDSPSVIAKG